MMKNSSTKEKATKGLKITFISLVILFLYFPIFIILMFSFSGSTDRLTGFTLKWYPRIFTSGEMFTAILNSFIVALLTTVIASIVGTFTAIGIHKLNRKRKQKMLLLNNVPILNADIVTGISIMLLCSLLLPIFPTIFGFTTMLIAHLFFTIPYVILNVLPKLNEIDENLYEAAVDLGCPPLKSLWKIIIPAIETGIISGALLAFTMSLDDFLISYFTVGNGFTNFSNWLYANISRKPTPSSYAYSSLVTITMLIIVLVPQFLKTKKKLKGVK